MILMVQSKSTIAARELLGYKMINNKLLEKVKEKIGDRKGAHDLFHFLRVRGIALKIAESEKADKSIVEAMVLLHDLVRHEGEREDASVEETLKEAEKILKEIGFDSVQVKTILDGIASHSLHSKLHKEPETIEAKILFDADKIDSVGEIGVARWFMTMGNKNISVKEAAQIYLQTIQKQQKKMNGKLYTELGNNLIQEDLVFSVQFLNNLIKKLS